VSLNCGGEPDIFYAMRVLKQYEGALPELLIREGGETGSYYGFNARFRTVVCRRTEVGIGVAELLPSPENQHD